METFENNYHMKWILLMISPVCIPFYFDVLLTSFWFLFFFFCKVLYGVKRIKTCGGF